MIRIEQVSLEIAEDLCRQITVNLPEYFGLPECNENYALGVHSRKNFAARVGESHIALLSLEFPYPQNANIYWMGTLREFQGQGIGKMLIKTAESYASKQGAITLSVETLSPFESDENYLKTYKFYESQGFTPLFNLKPQGYEWNMVYMIKYLRLQ